MVRIDTLIWALALAIGATGCQGHSAKRKQSSPPLLRVESALVSREIVSEPIWFATTVQPARYVTIEPRVNGYLGAVHFEGGARVKRGDRIFTIDPSLLNTTLLAAQAQLESARAKYIEAENNYNRALPLSEIDAISQSSLDQYRANYRSAGSAVRSAEESLRSAELDISYATILSPIDGVIEESPASLGDFVGVGTAYSTLTTISVVDTVEVKLAIPTSHYLRHRTGDDSTLLSDITLILPDSSIYPHAGTYSYTQKGVTPNSSTVVIVAKVPNPEAILKQNMFTRVRASLGRPRAQLLIPQRAVTQMQGISSVWVIAPDSSVSFRTVELGSKVKDMWQVNSGLSDNERVATSAQLKLHQGAKVIPINK